MEGNPRAVEADLAQQLTDRFGPLLTLRQLAELLDRSANGLRYSLRSPSDERTRALNACACRIGRRTYYPATDVARIIRDAGGLS